MALFGGKTVNPTPAQQSYEGAVNANLMNALRTWLPVQSYFKSSLTANQPGTEAIARGQAAGGAASSTAANLGALTNTLGSEGSGAGGVGSGRYVTAAADVNSAGANSKSSGLIAASTEAQREYAKGLQTSLGMDISDQSTAISGLQDAASIENQEAQTTAGVNTQNQEGWGQFAGFGLSHMSSGGGSGGSG